MCYSETVASSYWLMILLLLHGCDVTVTSTATYVLCGRTNHTSGGAVRCIRRVATMVFVQWKQLLRLSLSGGRFAAFIPYSEFDGVVTWLTSYAVFVLSVGGRMPVMTLACILAAVLLQICSCCCRRLCACRCCAVAARLIDRRWLDHGRLMEAQENAHTTAAACILRSADCLHFHAVCPSQLLYSSVTVNGHRYCGLGHFNQIKSNLFATRINIMLHTKNKAGMSTGHKGSMQLH